MISFKQLLCLAILFFNARELWGRSWDELLLGGANVSSLGALSSYSHNEAWALAHNPAWQLEKTQLSFSSAYQYSTESSARHSRHVNVSWSGKWKNFSLASLAYFPVGEISHIESASATEKQSFWSHRSQTPQMLFATNYQITKSHSVGLSVPLYFEASSNARFDFSDEGTNSKVESSFRPLLSWGFGWSSRWKAVRTSLAYWHRVQAKLNMNIEGELPLSAFSDDPFQIMASGELSYFFSPSQLNLNIESRLSKKFTMALLLQRTWWQAMPSPYLKLSYFLPKLKSQTHDFKSRNTFDFALATKYKLKSYLDLIFAYRFRRSPFSALPNNYFDSNQSIVGLGALFSIQKFVLGWHQRINFLSSGQKHYYFSFNVKWTP